MEQKVNELMDYYREHDTFLEFNRFHHKDQEYKTYNVYICKICGGEKIARKDRQTRNCGECIKLYNKNRANVKKALIKYYEENN